MLIIGHPSSGKTTFLAQFFTRLKKRKSDIKLLKTPENITAITEAVKSLSKGEETATTSAEKNMELILPIDIDGKEFNLVYPDYGGEQINNITELMEVDDKWKLLLNNSDKWLLFIRPNEISTTYDLSMSSYESIDAKKSTSESLSPLSKQSQFIELLQALLHAKEKGVKQSITSPTLTIILTCWDELGTDEKPESAMKEKLPMLLHFVETIWDKSAFNILGLSAQGFPLNSEKAKDKYRNDLPENFGYLVDSDGNQDIDITKLVKIALNV